ncbi:hypothetical protein FSS13T_24160 [Flavobacterium saliperosum S13]|nr:hypothetical protein [Flavobacterium saliperosum]ESU22965.1 hypothetical protein FSS13T_24160 [Flavobacterium saliperosum S13]
MKKLLLTLIFPSMLCAQVGIGTTNPLSDLHIAGDTSTIRIESLNAVNDPANNDGIKPSPAYVTALGDVTLDPNIGNGIGTGGNLSPINFLMTIPNFIPDGATNKGSIINNTTLETNKTGLFSIVPFTSPQAALIEVKYSVTTILSSTDLNTVMTPFNDISTRAIKYYFSIDLNNDGLDAVESSKKYGLNGQFYSSHSQGILGYSFTNGHGYTNIPPGNHSLHFFAEIVDGETKFTSVGIGGYSDTLKIRIYN